MTAKPWLKAYLDDVMMGGYTIPTLSVDVIATSPPYKKKDKFSLALMRALGGMAARVLKPGGVLFFNFGQLKEDLWRPYRAAEAVLEGGRGVLNEGQTIIWAKSIAIPSWKEAVLSYLDSLGKDESPNANVLKGILKQDGKLAQRGHYQPLLPSANLLNYCFEFVFMFWKEPGLDDIGVNRLAIGVPFVDKSNLRRGTRGKHGDIHCRGDLWFIPYKTTGPGMKKSHAYEFPEELVEMCLKVAGVDPGKTVLDPFGGGFTTPVVAKKLGMNCYATEVDPDTLVAGIRRWEEV